MNLRLLKEMSSRWGGSCYTGCVPESEDGSARPSPHSAWQQVHPTFTKSLQFLSCLHPKGKIATQTIRAAELWLHRMNSTELKGLCIPTLCSACCPSFSLLPFKPLWGPVVCHSHVMVWEHNLKLSPQGDVGDLPLAEKSPWCPLTSEGSTWRAVVQTFEENAVYCLPSFLVPLLAVVSWWRLLGAFGIHDPSHLIF